jgi:NADP-dependent 3-hydroxy acid dehydrogenase YdfG
MQQHYQYFKKESGHFINLSSAAGVKVFSPGTVYSGTKFAVSAISEGLRHEVGGNMGLRQLHLVRLNLN